MISWKYSLEKINGELDLAKKKKHALDKLLGEGKVSQTTYDSFSNEVAEAITDIEAKQKALIEKMTSKIGELEQQMKTLEFLLINSEIKHVSGEIEEDTYNREHEVLSLGLDTTRNELDEIKDAVSKISENEITIQDPVENQVEETQIEPETEEMETDTASADSSETSFTPEDEPSNEEPVQTLEEEALSTEDDHEPFQENQTEPEMEVSSTVDGDSNEPFQENQTEPAENHESSLEDYQDQPQPETETFSEETEDSVVVQEVSTENLDSQEGY